MRLDPVVHDSPLVNSLKAGVDFRRKLVDQGHSVRNAADDLCDSAERLAELVNQCFWTSMHVEENRAVRGSLCVCSPDQAPRARALYEPVPLSVKSLVTLMIASPRSSLAVHASMTGVEIWGVLDAIPMHTLSLRITDTGTVVASEGRDVIAVLERGEVYLPSSASDIDLTLLVAKALDKTKTFPERAKLAARIQRIVVAMHRQGHGGALLIVPTSTDDWKADVSFNFRFDDFGAMAVLKRISELEDAETRHSNLKKGIDRETPVSLLPMFEQSIQAHRDLLDALLSSIGELSAVDGAVVMDEELKVIGFGTKLQANTDCFQVLTLDALSKEIVNIPYMQLGGTRHQSAARFVYKNPEAMAFVASQDGRLTLLAWVLDRGQVVAVRRLEHFVWDCLR
ncbi:MAG: putative sensor domain DACNV-containing protein [Burkholderiales bacterium]